jgi:hypothetical protein
MHTINVLALVLKFDVKVLYIDTLNEKTMAEFKDYISYISGCALSGLDAVLEFLTLLFTFNMHVKLECRYFNMKYNFVLKTQ